MNETDEEALSWAGDADRAQMPLPKRSGRQGASSSRQKPASKGAAKEARAAAKKPKSSEDAGQAAAAAGNEGLSSAALIGLGALGGAMLLETIAWLITALRNPITISDALGQTMFTLGLWFAVLAPVLWFALAWLIWRERRLGRLFLALLVGVLVMLPWPYFSWAG